MANDTKKLFLNDAPLLTPLITTPGITTPPTTAGVTNTLYNSEAPQPPASSNSTNIPSQPGIPNNAAKSAATIAFQPNVLDYYDTYTYHWKLFIVPTSAATSGDVLNTDIQTIIVESGVTDLTIDKIEINSIATPSVQSSTGTMTTLKFEIVEPSGASLIDQMYYESIALGIGNWMVSPYYLQLEFRGRDPETAESVINGAPSGISALKWVWPIKLTDSKINVTQVGSKYEFSAIFYDEVAQTNAYSAIMQNITLSGLTTFGDAMKKLETKLNQDCYEKLIDNYSIPDSYTIVVDNELVGIPLINPSAKKSTSRGADFVDFSHATAIFQATTGIDTIVNNLLGSTETFQVQMKGSDTPAGQPKPSTTETDQMKKLWRIITETKPIAFDSLRQDNAVAITIYIIKYDIGVLDTVASQTGQTPNTKDAETKRLNEYLSKSILRKNYNYIFTGLNDQIITLDLNMNLAFAAAVSRFGGAFIDSATNSTGINKNDTEDNRKKAAEIIRKTLQLINNASPNTNLDSAITTAEKAIAATKVNPEIAVRYNLLLENAVPAKKQAFTQSLQTTNQKFSGGLNSGRQIGPYDKNGKYTGQQTGSLVAASSATGNLKFISDVNIYSAEAKQAQATSDSLIKGKLRPIPYREAPYENNIIGKDPANDSARAQTSSLFATALYSGGLDASLQQIKLTIKGDPFWIFPRNLGTDTTSLQYKSNYADQQQAITELKTAQKTYDASINLYGTDNFFVIRFRTPRLFNDTTGIVDPFTTSDTFSGVYKVTNIISNFAGGKFTQELSAYLDPVINVSNHKELLDSIENGVSQVHAVTPPVITIVPPAAVKLPRLVGTSISPKGQDNSGISPSTLLANTYGKISSVNTSNIPYDTNNTPGKLFLPEGP